MTTYVVTKDNLIVNFGDTSLTTNSDNPFFESIVNAVQRHDWRQVEHYFHLDELIKEYSDGALSIVNGEIYYTRGTQITTPLTDWVINMIKTNIDNRYLLRFIANVERNEVEHVRNQLHSFIAKGGLPITQDGHFIAFKSIDNCYKDLYSHTMDNRVGRVVYLKREECSTINNACSAGLHFGTEDFVLHSYKGPIRVAVKINPLDVLAVPDFEGKGRTSMYRVIGEIGKGMEFEQFRNAIVDL